MKLCYRLAFAAFHWSQCPSLPLYRTAEHILNTPLPPPMLPWCFCLSCCRHLESWFVSSLFSKIPQEEHQIPRSLLGSAPSCCTVSVPTAFCVEGQGSPETFPGILIYEVTFSKARYMPAKASNGLGPGLGETAVFWVLRS